MTPLEHGAWLGDFPVFNTTDFNNIYGGFQTEMGALLTFPSASSVNTSSSVAFVDEMFETRATSTSSTVILARVGV